MAFSEFSSDTHHVLVAARVSLIAILLVMSITVVKRYCPTSVALLVQLGKQTTNHCLKERTLNNPESEASARRCTTGQQLDAARVGVLHPTEYQSFALTQITLVSHNVTIYRFALPLDTDQLGLNPGQHISIAATPQGSTSEVVRSYTPISTEKDLGYFDVMIKKYPQGLLSTHLSTLSIGATIKVRGPKGAMRYTPNLCEYIGMIAGGTGVTPMLQIIQSIVQGRPRNGGNDRTKVDLIFANVCESDILLKDKLDALAAEDDGINVHYVLNNPPEGWTGGVGFVTADMLKDKFPNPDSNMKILICGPPPMVGAMKKITESLGFESARLVSKLNDQVFCF